MSDRIKMAWRAVADYFTRPDPVTRDLISMVERHAHKAEGRFLDDRREIEGLQSQIDRLTKASIKARAHE